MAQRSNYPGFWHSVLLCVAFVFAQGCFVTPVSIGDAIFHTRMVGHPAVMGLVNIASCAVVLLLARLIGKRPLARMLPWRGIGLWAMAAVPITCAGAIVLNSELDNVLRTVLPPPEWAVQLFGNLSINEEHFWASAFLLVIVAPITEELIFRGVILRGMLHQFSAGPAILLSSFLFAGVHLNPWQFCTAFGLGLIFGWWYSRTGSLIPCMIGHAIANSALFWASYLPFNVPGFNVTSPGTVAFQPAWFDLLGVGVVGCGVWLFRQATPLGAGVAPGWEDETMPVEASSGEIPPVISSGDNQVGPEQNERQTAQSYWSMSTGSPPVIKRQGMATASMVLGILSVMCFGLFAGVPAIILGHKAHRRAVKSPEQYGGAGQAMAGFVMGYASLITTLFLAGVGAGLLLPALAKAKSKAQSIACMNNMKQIGLAFRIWATDHQDRFPFNASTNANGIVNAEPIGDDPVHVFQTLSNELATPKILVCPADGSKRPATDFPGLQLSNVSYDLETGPEVTASHPGEVLARCPIHGHELYCDGSVQQTRWP